MTKTVVITGEALDRVRGMPCTFSNGLRSYGCAVITSNFGYEVQVPVSLSQIKSGQDLVEYFGLM